MLTKMDDFWFQLVDLQFVLSILTVIYYSYLLSIMLTSEKNVFHSAFFKIFIVTGFFDIMCVFAIEWVRADLKIGFGPRFEVISRIASVMTATNFFTHIIGCLLMTLNRYMAACHPRIYSVVWSPKVLGLLLILDVVISYASYTPLFPVKFVYEWRNDTWKLIGRERPVPEVRITLAVGATIYEIVSVLLIAKTAYALRKAVRDQRTRKSNQDLGLVMVTVLDCVLGVLECIYEISAIFPVDSVNSPVIYWINRNNGNHPPHRQLSANG